jgi:YfiH family protein
MLQRTTHANGVVTYSSARFQALHIAHGFSTRIGGVSSPPYDTLDLSTPTPGNHDAIRENSRRFGLALGCPDHHLVTVSQVHGAAVHIARAASGAAEPRVQADALVARDPWLLLAIRVADCVPVLLADPDGGAVAAVHAGWRGIIAGVLPAAVAALAATAHCPAVGLVGAIGPCLGCDRFEVGPEVAQAFGNAGLSHVVHPAATPASPEGKPHVDLRAAARAQLERAGLLPQSIDDTDRCTCRDQAEFFSHRRDHGITGRMAAAIAPRAIAS